MVEEIPSRLREELNRLNLSMAAAARNAGESSSQRLKDVLSGRQKCPVDLLARLESLGVDIFYVLTGRLHAETEPEASAFRVEDGSPVGLGSQTPSADAVPVAMYDIEAAAGAGRSLEAEPIKTTLYFPPEQLSALGLSPGRVAGVQVRGDSMEGTLEDGDWTLVDLGNTDPRQEGVFLLLISGERRIKRVQRLAGGALYLISDNEHYQPEMIPPERMREVEILGRCEVRIGRIS
ncbi:Phage repressor protein C, contains Cro/C1-type HTH and peptisase s24 domains [Halomonas saccharevitans]|uniref:Phage repressor protein C, contains Cro/C1-type HTH and peptisase s24 domains n=1 Tax=Halomonas saccharevitans TaxID=416872 RepID=A0A1I6YX83_9GAMM|nr:Phage repressor protein C, contains Cro/C1-type HTH and peptisase s24 domains [Halomonas saccharevitans]